MPLVVRDAITNDAAEIARLMHLLWQDSPVVGKDVYNYIVAGKGRIVVAEEQGKILGLLNYFIRFSLSHAAEACFIEDLVVDERVRDKGIGSALMTELFDRLKSLNCAEVTLTVVPENTRAIQFYRNCGLTEQIVCLEKHFV
jgi:ribosomal protein S18 acetylase RimI-like enzyme